MAASTVSVIASVERAVLPDAFSVSASVSAEGADHPAAAAALAARFAELEQAVAGLAGLDVRRGQVNSHWGWSDKRTEQRVWIANRSMTVAGDDVTAAGDVVAALGRLSEVQIDGPRWHVDRDNPVYAQLQTEVVAEARGRAARYAAALGGELGRLVELSDPGSAHHSIPLSGARQALAGRGYGDMAFDAEELTVSATVNASWRLVLPE